MQKFTGMEAVRDRMSLARLARELGITRGAVAQWEKVPAFMEKHFIEMMQLLKINFPSDETDPLPGIPTTDSGL